LHGDLGVGGNGFEGGKAIHQVDPSWCPVLITPRRVISLRKAIATRMAIATGVPEKRESERD
jgi:hypothetical protein